MCAIGSIDDSRDRFTGSDQSLAALVIRGWRRLTLVNVDQIFVIVYFWGSKCAILMG